MRDLNAARGPCRLRLQSRLPGQFFRRRLRLAYMSFDKTGAAWLNRAAFLSKARHVFLSIRCARTSRSCAARRRFAFSLSSRFGSSDCTMVRTMVCLMFCRPFRAVHSCSVAQLCGENVSSFRKMLTIGPPTKNAAGGPDGVPTCPSNGWLTRSARLLPVPRSHRMRRAHARPDRPEPCGPLRHRPGSDR